MNKNNLSKGNTVSNVTELVTPLIEQQNLILWDVRFEKEGAMWLLKIIIDKDGGVNIDDCENLSRPLDKLLDEKDPIDQSYCLEVSSAGIERELKKDWHFLKSIGKKVQAKLIRPFEGEREFIGELTDFKNNTITIKCPTGEYSFLLSDLAFVRWAFEM
ncbi:MAG: ribosome maturation factor RimP [Oscillospiraceae bacterium]